MTLEVMNHKLTHNTGNYSYSYNRRPRMISWEDYFHVSESIGRELSRIDKKIKEMENK